MSRIYTIFKRIQEQDLQDFQDLQDLLRVFPKSLNVAVKPARMRVWHPRAPRCGEKTLPLHVGRGPVPRQAIGHASTRGGQAPALRCQGKRVLITPVEQVRQILPRSGAGEPELQGWARCLFGLGRARTIENGVTTFLQIR